MKILMFSSLFLLTAFSASFAQKYNFDVENVGLDCGATYKALLSPTNSALPDPFAMHNGTRISDKSEWACRRNEVKKDLEQYEIGPKPDPSTATVAATYSGNTLTVKVTTKDGSINLTSTVSGSGDCIAIGMNGDAGNISGCKQIPFNHNQVVTYEMNGTIDLNDPFYKVYPDLKGKMGKYAAWSWGISRLIDGIAQVKDQLGVDMSKIGIQGCSYAGKMALFGGAMDERVTLTVVQESGGGGINAWRYSKAFTARTGRNIEKIDNTSSSWFLSSMLRLNPDALPHDHHQLIAMIAPRATIILGNPDMEWLGDESGYKSTIAARKVWQAFGVPDYIGFDFAGIEALGTKHGHCAAYSSQATNVTAFVNRFLKGQNVNTKIEANRPNHTGYSFNLDTTVSWTVPTLTGTYGSGGTSSPSGSSSSSAQDGSSSSSSATSVQVCGEYQSSFCGGIAYDNVLGNSTTIPATGTCLFIEDFEGIQPNLNSTVSINGEENICGSDWPDCSYNDKPATTKDGGYYVYVKAGTINSYQNNGWKGIVAKAKPECTTPIAIKAPLTHFSVRVISGGAVRIEANAQTVVEIFDLKGNKAASFNVSSGSQTVKLSLPSGVYFAKARGIRNVMFVVR